jgi:hypothetical protein
MREFPHNSTDSRMGNCWCRHSIDDYEFKPQEEEDNNNTTSTTLEEGNSELRSIPYRVGDTLIIKADKGLLNVCVKSINVKSQTMVVMFPSKDFVSMQEKTIGVFASCIVNRDQLPEPTEVKAFAPSQVSELVLTRFRVENKGLWKHGNWMRLEWFKSCGQDPSSVHDVNVELDKKCAEFPFHLGLFLCGDSLKGDVENWAKSKGYNNRFHMPFPDWDAYVCLCLKKL